MAFRVALTADFFDAAGKSRYADVGMEAIYQHPQIDITQFATHQPEINADQIGGANGVIILTPRTSAQSLANPNNLLALGRFGVGYDNVDVAACTANDVLLYIAAGAVDYSVAEATVGWMIGISHHFLIKDRLVRDAVWETRGQYMASELREKTLGVIGFGGIGREVVRLLAPFGMHEILVFDPFITPEAATKAGCRSVSLDELLLRSDFVSVHCPLTDETRNLIGAKELALMKPTAFLINTARGGIIDDAALYDVLKARKIAGAAIDCFVGEPLTAPPPVAELDNVLLAPHCIAWSNEMFRDIGRAASQGMVDLVEGRVPGGVVNPEVLERSGFQAKWRRLRG